eukprot:scaffold176710_cov42-Prasinocladus_malaysianus.AAC.1
MLHALGMTPLGQGGAGVDWHCGAETNAGRSTFRPHRRGPHGHLECQRGLAGQRGLGRTHQCLGRLQPHRLKHPFPYTDGPLGADIGP